MLVSQNHLAATPAAVATVLSEWETGSRSRGALVLLPEAERNAVPELQACFRNARIPLAGAIFPRLVVGGDFVDHGMLLIGLEPMPGIFLLDRLSSGERTAASRISTAAREVGGDAPQPTLFLMFDAMVPNIASILDSLFRRDKNAFRYAGANAGSETFQPMPCLFDAETLAGDAVLGLVLPNEAASTAHGYPVAKTLMQATSTSGNRIQFIDRRPAMDVYREVIATDFGVTLTADNFYDYAVHFPFGVVSALDVMVRIPVAFDPDGTIHCVGEVPEHSLLRLIRAPDAGQDSCVTAIADALAPAPLRDWRLAFYCAGRRMHFGTSANGELVALQRKAAAKALVGALSLGEISTNLEFGIPEFHNAAIVCL